MLDATSRAGRHSLRARARTHRRRRPGGAARPSRVVLEHEVGLQGRLRLELGRLLPGLHQELVGGVESVLADGEDGDLGRGCIENGQSRRCSDGASAATFAVDELLGKDLHEVAGFVDTEDELGGVLQRSYPIHDLDLGIDLRAPIRRRVQAEAEGDSLGVFDTHPATDGGRGPGALEDLDVVLERECVLVNQEGCDGARLQDQGRLVVVGQEAVRAILEELETRARGVREGARGLQWVRYCIRRWDRTAILYRVWLQRCAQVGTRAARAGENSPHSSP